MPFLMKFSSAALSHQSGNCAESLDMELKSEARRAVV